jgi:RND family efflux transporter MFP subunit
MNSVPPASFWRPSGATISALLLGFLVLLAFAFLVGYLPLQRREATLRAEAEAQQKGLPRVAVMRVGRSTDQNVLKLPGTMQALTEAPILARADGYLKRRLADIGDRVHAGQVLAEIDAPELDQQSHQAEAAIEQAQAAAEQAEASLEQGKANRELARMTADRWKMLVDRGISPQQEGDQYQAQLAAQDANVKALEKSIQAQRSSLAAVRANLARLQDVQGYRVVKAPFDGVITLRNVDVGALVGTGTTLLYRIAQIGTLRTYVNVPQVSVNAVHVGQAAALTVSHLPGRTFPRHRRPDSERARSRQPDDARRGRRAEPGRRAVSRNLRRGRSERLASRPAARRACDGDSLPDRRRPGRRRAARSDRASSEDHRRARLRRSRRNPPGDFGRDDDCRGARRRSA